MAVIDYSPIGGEIFRVPYSFKDQQTIKISLYPEDLTIHKVNNRAISFSPVGNRFRIEIDVVYEYVFHKIST